MAERRMFAKSIVLSDAFLDMPMSARCLYFTLGMLADDDGFVGSPKSIMRQCGASQDDMAILLSKRYILGFESGIIVIKHWRMNNYLKNDRHKDTTYLEEMATLSIDEKGAYTEMYPCCIQNGYKVDTQVSIGKNSIDNSVVTQHTRFTKPSLEEIKQYCLERHNNVNAQRFIDYYDSNGWMVGKNHMKDWKATIRTWEQKDGFKKDYQDEEMDADELEKQKQELKEMFKK